MKKYLFLLLWCLCFSVASADYFQDYSTAYKWAATNWIVSDDPLSSPDLYSVVSRGEFASMLVRFSKNVLNKKDPEESVCNFVDMSALDQEYQSAALWLCDKGVMGLWKSTFSPNASLTLAELGTSLSRLFWWNKFSKGETFYSNHLGALLWIWAINDISEPFGTVLHWDVLVILMNSVKWAVGEVKYPKVSLESDTEHGSAWNKSSSDWYYRQTPKNSVEDKIARCYNSIDYCRSNSMNSDIACVYVCCDSKGKWLTAFSTWECAPRPGEVVETPKKEGKAEHNSAWILSGAKSVSFSSWMKTIDIINSWGNYKIIGAITNCWLKSTDSEDISECWKCLWFKKYSEEWLKLWAQENDSSLLNCDEAWTCSLNLSGFATTWALTGNKFVSLSYIVGNETLSWVVNTWLNDTFKKDDIPFIKKCEEQRYAAFQKKDNDVKIVNEVEEVKTVESVEKVEADVAVKVEEKTEVNSWSSL